MKRLAIVAALVAAFVLPAPTEAAQTYTQKFVIKGQTVAVVITSQAPPNSDARIFVGGYVPCGTSPYSVGESSSFIIEAYINPHPTCALAQDTFRVNVEVQTVVSVPFVRYAVSVHCDPRGAGPMTVDQWAYGQTFDKVPCLVT